MIQIRNKPDKATALTDWCREVLSASQWSKLRSSVRKRRQRWQNFDTQLTITISRSAHAKIVRLANRDNVTIMQIVDRLATQATKRR